CTVPPVMVIAVFGETSRPRVPDMLGIPDEPPALGPPALGLPPAPGVPPEPEGLLGPPPEGVEAGPALFAESDPQAWRAPRVKMRNGSEARCMTFLCCGEATRNFALASALKRNLSRPRSETVAVRNVQRRLQRTALRTCCYATHHGVL